MSNHSDNQKKKDAEIFFLLARQEGKGRAEMVKVFMAHSGMNHINSLEWLDKNEWDYKKALGNFWEQRMKKSIPKEAYQK